MAGATCLAGAFAAGTVTTGFAGACAFAGVWAFAGVCGFAGATDLAGAVALAGVAGFAAPAPTAVVSWMGVCPVAVSTFALARSETAAAPLA